MPKAPHSRPPAPESAPLMARVFKSKHTLYIALLGLLAIALFSSFVFSNKVLYGSDILGNLDSRVVYADALLKHHQFPTWMSPRLGGMPTVDASFGDTMYPPSMLVHALLPPHRALGFKIVLHVFLAGLFFYILLHRGFGTSRLVAFAGGALYMLNPQFISLTYSGHEGKIFVTALLPYMVWRLKVLMEAPGLRNLTLLSLGIALSLLTAHIQLTYFVLWGLFAYWVFFSILAWRRNNSLGATRKPAMVFWGAVLIGIGVAFIQFFPTFAFVREAHSVRGVDRGFEFASSWSLHWPDLFSMWVPEFGGYLSTYWGENAFKLNTEYAGAVALLLGILAVVHRPSRWRWFWAGVALFALSYSLGRHSLVFRAAYAIVPGVRKFRACSMIMFWFSFAGALLAARFLADVVSGAFADKNDKQRARWSKGLLIGAGGATLLALLFSLPNVAASFAGGLVDQVLLDSPMSGSQITHRQVMETTMAKSFIPNMWLWWVYAMGLLGTLWAIMRRAAKPTLLVWVVLGIAVVDLFRVNRGFGDQESFIRAVNPRPYFYTEPALEKLAKDMDTAPFRCFALPGTLPQNNIGVHRLEGISGFHDNELRWYRAFRGDQSDRNYFQGLLGRQPNGTPYLKVAEIEKGNPFLNLINARYLLARQGGRVIPLENRAALPRVSFVRNYVVMDTAATVSALQQGGYDIRTTVALLAEPPNPPKGSPNNTAPFTPRLPITWEKYSPNYRRVQVTCPAEGFLRLSEVYYEGWEIAVDGEPVPVLQADCALMAIRIGKGKHTVEMWPRSLYLGKASLVSFPLIGLLVLYWLYLAWQAFRRRRHTETQPQ